VANGADLSIDFWDATGTYLGVTTDSVQPWREGYRFRRRGELSSTFV
jgi:hypothetical protein